MADQLCGSGEADTTSSTCNPSPHGLIQCLQHLLTLRFPCRYLQNLGVAQLRALFEEVYGERTQSNNSVWLRKKLSQPRDDSVGAGKKLLVKEDETHSAKHSNVSDERAQTSGEPSRPQRASRSTVAKTEQLQQLHDEQQTAAGTGSLFAGASGTAARWDMGTTNGKGLGNVRGSHSYSNTPHRVHQHTDDSDTSARSLIGLQVRACAITTPRVICPHL